IKAKLGEGGMGAVYLGEHPLIGRKVAVKVLLDELVANESIATRFFNEAKAANDIRHQNIVEIVDFGRTPKPEGGGHIVYIMMELLEGESLAGRMHRDPLSIAETQYILGQCCSGLAASHSKGIIHRDLKPDNLFLIRRGSDDNFVKILDFGIAKLTATANTNAKTRTGTLIGTPSYMSPEQCAGRGNIDARSDIYSLGIVAYEMLTHQLPFVGEGFGDIVVAHITEAPKPPSLVYPGIPAGIEAIVMRAIEKDPAQRFQSMEEFGVALSDPEAYLASPHSVAVAGAVASAHTTSVPVVTHDPGSASGARPFPKSPSQKQPVIDAPTVQARKPGNTTLSGATGEVSAQAGARKRIAVIGSSAAVAALAAVIGVVVLRGASASSHVTPPPAVVAPAAVVPSPTVAPKPPEQVSITFTSEPPGATIKRGDDGKVAGVTPLTIQAPKGSPGFDVQVELAGYRAEKRTIGTDVNRELSFALVKEAPVVADKPVVHKKKATATGDKDKAGDDLNLKLLPPEL
ncbi:MAG TPA: serine/threonine-protein kinase, partial [Polyangia bacterium]|nr:serine/threonine-protein kinase [Polyangia bacterium]